MKTHVIWIQLCFIITSLCLDTITIGASMSAASEIPFMKEFGISSKKSLELFDYLFQQQQNGTIIVGATPDTPGIPYQWKWKILEDEGNYTKMMENVKILCKDPEVQVIVPTSYSNFAIPASDHCDKIVVSPSILPQSFYDNHTNLFQVLPPAENWLDIVLPNLRYSGLTRVGIIHGSLDFYEAVCNGITDKKAKHVGIDVVAREKYTLSESDNLGNTTELEDAIDELIRTNSQVLFYCGLPPGGEHILNYLHKMNYHFESIVFVPWRDGYLTLPPHLIDYVMFSVLSHEDMRSEPDQYFDSHLEFYETYANFTLDKTPVHITSMFSFYAAAVIKDAFERSKSISREDFRESLLRTSLPTLMGTIEFDGSQRPEMLTTILQRLNNSWHIVWPPYVSSTAIVMQSPSWTDRVYDESYSTVEWLFISIATLLIFVTICVMIAIFRWRHEQIIDTSMPLFLMIIGIGSILIYMSIYFWLNHQLTKVTCIVRVWVLNVGFALMFGSMFSKNHSVLKVWTRNLTKHTTINLKAMVIIVLVILSVHVVLLFVYTFLGDVEALMRVTQPHKPFYDQEYCSNNLTGSIMLILMTCWGFTLIVYKLIIAWRMRKIPFLTYNESKILVFTTYNLAFFSVIVLVITVNEDRIDPDVLFILRSTCIILGVLFTQLILYGNKLWLFYKKKTNRSKINKTYNTNGPTPGVSTHSTSSATDAMQKVKDSNDNNKVLITREEYKEYKNLKKALENVNKAIDE